jgi:hypothetical protein
LAIIGIILLAIKKRKRGAVQKTDPVGVTPEMGTHPTTRQEMNPAPRQEMSPIEREEMSPIDRQEMSSKACHPQELEAREWNRGLKDGGVKK